MEQEVYGDLLFCVNFSMDFLCFYLTAKLLHRRLPLWRTVFASAIGGVYAVAALLIRTSGALALIFDLAVCVCMNCAVFCQKKLRPWRLLLCAAVYFAVSAALGGCMSALYSLFNRADAAGGQDGGTGAGTVGFFLLAAVAALITLLGGRFFRRSAAGTHCRIEVTLAGKRAATDAFVDSGNLLREPLSGLPVVVMDPGVAEALLGRRGCDELLAGRMPADLGARLRPVPSTGATGKKLLIAVRPDTVTVTDEKGRSHSVQAYFVLTELPGADRCHALISPELLL